MDACSIDANNAATYVEEWTAAVAVTNIDVVINDFEFC